jgi:hypothetical protein
MERSVTIRITAIGQESYKRAIRNADNAQLWVAKIHRQIEQDHGNLWPTTTLVGTTDVQYVDAQHTAQVYFEFQREQARDPNPAAVALGTLGRATNSEAQKAAARANGKRGGRPRKTQ